MPRVATRLLRTLEAHDVEHIFGVCGDTSLGLYRALAEHDHDIEHVLARDERAASFMADAYARLSDRPGICEGPSGGGATYLLPGIAEANGSAVPVIAFNTDIPVKYRGRGVLTEVPQEQLFDPVTKWSGAVELPEQGPRKIREAFRQATSGRPGAVHLSLPMDVLAEKAIGDAYADPAVTRYPAYRPAPDPARVSAAASLLESSDRPLVVAGGGVHTSRAWTELRTFAETVGLPVAQTLTGAGCIGDSPYSIGVVGENGAREYANEMLAEADTVFLAGTAAESVWTRKWTTPADGDVRTIHADIDPTSIGKNYRTEVALLGDLRKTLVALTERMDADEKWSVAAIAERHREWRSPYEERFDADEFPLRPERMVAGAAEVLDDDAVIVSDPGTSCPYFAALYPFSEPGRHWVTPRAHGGLGYTIPAITGVRYAYDGQVIGFTGDGSFGMAVGDLETLSRYDLSVTVVVVKNDSYSWIEAGQRNLADFSFGVDFQEADYAAIAEEFGVAGFRVETAAEYESTLEAAIAVNGPALVDLPTRRLPSLPDAPVDWLEPD